VIRNYYHSVETRLLRAFVGLAEELHFGRAAARLGIAQPQLSVQIRSLETMLGARLFDRDRRHVALTEVGGEFVPEAQAILARIAMARRRVQSLARGEAGCLTVGFTGSAPLNPVMRGIIGRFRRQWPHVALSLAEMSTTAQFSGLVEGKIDAGFLRPGPGAVSDLLTVLTVSREPLVVVLPADHSLAERESLSIAELAGQSFILHPRERGPGLYDTIIGLCAAAGFRPSVDIEVHQLPTIVSLAATGLGISIVPEALSNAAMEGARFIPLRDRGAQVTLAVAFRHRDDRPVTRHFRIEVERAAQRARDLKTGGNDASQSAVDSPPRSAPPENDA